MLVVPFSSVVTTAVVFPPFIKFTVSYGLTKSRASLLFCKFHPAFNTSPTVAALFPDFLTISAASLAVYGALFVTVTGAPFSITSVPSGFFTPPGVVPFGSTTCFKLFPTLLNTVGLFVFSSPLFIDAFTSDFSTGVIGVSSFTTLPALSTTFPDATSSIEPSG